MDFTHLISIKPLYIIFPLISLVSCGGGSSDSDSVTSDHGKAIIVTTHYFRDLDGSSGEIGGDLYLQQISSADEKAKSIRMYWADAANNKSGEAWLDANVSAGMKITIPFNTVIPVNAKAFLIHPLNKVGSEVGKPSLIKFHDFKGNALVSGPGGIADSFNNPSDDHPNSGDGITKNGAWYYGGLSPNDRVKISVYRSDLGGGTCVYDNGLVAVTDMAHEIDPDWGARSFAGLKNHVNEVAFPSFSFLCDKDNPINNLFEVPRVKDEYGPWTYSQLNDAMFYGTKVYDTYVKYLGEPPLEDKIRLRVHYGSTNTTNAEAYWDGVYANFKDAQDVSFFTSLDIIAHEVGHGVLSRISDMDIYKHTLEGDARTLHEAFGDMSGVIAKYEFSGELNWNHNEESKMRQRHLDRIKTESTAISSMLDYDDAGTDYYLRVGMITYPFYLLTNKWGVEDAYNVIIDAARNCWTYKSNLIQAASCIEQAAIGRGLPEIDVEEAFKAVKIKLFDQGVLSHFKATTNKLQVIFTDNSQSTGAVNTWLWEFGDGQSSNVQNPVHSYITAGSYSVKLTVNDSSGDQDSFERSFTLTE